MDLNEKVIKQGVYIEGIYDFATVEAFDLHQRLMNMHLYLLEELCQRRKKMNVLNKNMLCIR